MSFIKFQNCCSKLYSPNIHLYARQSKEGHSFLYEVPWSHSHTHKHSVGRLSTSGRPNRRDLYLTTHNNHNRQTSMIQPGFEPAIPASERPQIHLFDRVATGTGILLSLITEMFFWRKAFLEDQKAIEWAAKKTRKNKVFNPQIVSNFEINRGLWWSEVVIPHDIHPWDSACLTVTCSERCQGTRIVFSKEVWRDSVRNVRNSCSILTPWNRVLLEKLTGFQLVKKFPEFYGYRSFITAATSARQLSLSWVSSIQSIPPHPTS